MSDEGAVTQKTAFVGRARFCRRYPRKHALEESRCPGQSCQAGSRWQTQLTALCCVTNASWHAPCSDSDNAVTRFIGRLIANQIPTHLRFQMERSFYRELNDTFTMWNMFVELCRQIRCREKVCKSVGRSNQLIRRCYLTLKWSKWDFTWFPTGDNNDNNIQAIDPLAPAGLVDVGHVCTVFTDLLEEAKVVQTQGALAFAGNTCRTRTWRSIQICYEIPTIPPDQTLLN